MKKFKILGLLASGLISNAFAAESSVYSNFQAIDNQYNIGYGFNFGSTKDSANQTGSFTGQSLNIEMEKLWDEGVWLDVSANVITAYYQTNNPTSNPYINNGNISGSNANFGGVNAKLGYAVPVASKFLVTPYVLGGRNTNVSTYALDNIALQQKNIVDSYFWTGGLGGRMEYLPKPNLDLYFDFAAVYNLSMTPIQAGVFSGNPSYGSFSPTVGFKYNVYKELQLGASAYYAVNFAQDNLDYVGTSGIPSYSYYKATNNYGAAVTLGMTY